MTINRKSGNVALIVLSVVIIVASVAAVIYFLFLAPNSTLKLGGRESPISTSSQTPSIDPNQVKAASLQKELDAISPEGNFENLDTTTDTTGL